MRALQHVVVPPLCLFAFAVAIVLLSSGGISIRGPHQIQTLIGSPETIRIVLRNRALTGKRIVRVWTSCGCLRITGAPDRLGPFGHGEITIEVDAGSRSGTDLQSVFIKIEGNEVYEHRLIARAVPLVAGFPDEAMFDRAVGEAPRTTVSAGYRTSITRVELWSSRTGLRLTLDPPGPGSAIMAPPGVFQSEEGWSLAVWLRPDQPPVWVAPARLRGPDEPPESTAAATGADPVR